MSRAFGGTSADLLTFAAGSAPPDEGPITIVVIAKATNVGNFTGWMVRGRKVAAAVWAMLVDSGKLFMESDFGAGGPAHGNNWCVFIGEKASGSVIPRWHKVDLTTMTWTHQNDTSNVADGSGPIDNVLVGGDGGSAGWRGEIGLVATWASQPFANDAAVEAVNWLSAAAILAKGPGWMVRFNQASVTTTVTDDTGNGGDQTARAGTTVGIDDPPGFDYALTAPPSQGSVALTLGLALGGTGSRPSAGSVAGGLGLALAGTGARPSAGSTAGGLSLGIDVDGERPSAGSAALGLGLAVDASGGRSSGGSAALGLGLAPAAQGARTAAGAAALTLGLGIDADGSRASSGSAALGLRLALAATGEEPPIVPAHAGSVALTLNLALAATGAAEVSCLPFPWACSDVLEFAGCADLPAFPGTCVPVPSFSEVTP